MKQVVKSTDLSSDFGLTSNNKLFNTNTIGASGTPNNTTVPPVIEKIWFWVDTTQNQITHFWKPSTSTWISFKDFTERSINLNNVTPTFTPNDILQPTTTEVESWVNANLTGNDKVNGTVLTYYKPIETVYTNIISFPIYNYTPSYTIGTDAIFVTSIKINNVELVTTSIDVNVNTYSSIIYNLINNYAIANSIQLTIDNTTYFDDYYLEVYNLSTSSLLTIQLDYTVNGTLISHTINNILSNKPQIGSIKEPVLTWVLTQEGIVKTNNLQPFIKKNNNISSSNVEILETDSVFRTGKVNLGADFNDLPENINYELQIQGNQLTKGKTKSDYFISTTNTINITIDVVNGNDNLDLIEYPEAKFKTGTKALEWISKVQQDAWFILQVDNSSTTNRAELSNSSFRLTGKNIRLTGGYWLISNSFRNQNVYWDIVSTNIKLTGFGSFDSSESKFSFQNSTIEHEAVQGFIIGNSTTINFISTVINFRANNQYLFFPNVSNIWQVAFAQCTFNANGFTGLSIIRPADIGDNFELFLQESQTIPSTISVAGCFIHSGRNIVLGQQTFDITNNNYKAVLHSTTPIRLPDISAATEQTSSTKNLTVDTNGVVGWKTDGTIALKTVNRAFSKVGSSQATNNDSINNSDAIYHVGGVVIGDTNISTAKFDVYQDLGGNTINPILSFRDLINRVDMFQRLTAGAFSQSVQAGDTAFLSKENLSANNGFVIGKHNGATIRFGTSNAKSLGLFARDIATPDIFINSVGNVLIKKTTDSGYGDLQVPVISLGYNTWHYSEDGVARMYFGQNSVTYLSAFTGFPVIFRLNGDERYRFYSEGLNIYSDGLHDFTFAKTTIANSSTSREFTFRKEANNQDFRFYDWNGTDARNWWKVATQSNRLELANTIFANHSSNVGIGTSTPDVNTILDIVSTDKGSRPFPSMTQAQRTALNAPTGTHVYQTDGTEGVYVKKSTGWVFAY